MRRARLGALAIAVCGLGGIARADTTIEYFDETCRVNQVEACVRNIARNIGGMNLDVNHASTTDIVNRMTTNSPQWLPSIQYCDAPYNRAVLACRRTATFTDSNDLRGELNRRFAEALQKLEAKFGEQNSVYQKFLAELGVATVRSTAGRP